MGGGGHGALLPHPSACCWGGFVACLPQGNAFCVVLLAWARSLQPHGGDVQPCKWHRHHGHLGNGAAPIGTALPWPGCATRCLFSAGNMTLQAILFCFFLCFAPGWFLRPMSPPESIAPEVCSCSEKLICAAGLCGLLALCTSTRKPIFLLAADPRLLIGILFLWPLCLRNGLKSPADWPKPVLLPGAGQTPCGCFLVGTTPSSPCAVPSVEVALKNHSSRFLFSFFVVCFVCWFFFFS